MIWQDNWIHLSRKETQVGVSEQSQPGQLQQDTQALNNLQ